MPTADYRLKFVIRDLQIKLAIPLFPATQVSGYKKIGLWT